MIHPDTRRSLRITPLIVTIAMTLTGCQREESHTDATQTAPDTLARVGSLTINQSDLDHRLTKHYGGRTDDQTRQVALDDLVKRAQFAQAALHADLDTDPVIRDEVSNLLAARLREKQLHPKLMEQLEIPRERLTALYQEQLSRFQAPEKRQVAVLWLNPGLNPEKAELAADKLRQARAFLLKSQDLLAHPEKGFSALGADYSEHSASRHRGGLVGWLEPAGGLDSWTKAVADIAFSIEKTGAMSEVTIRPEGVFLVRLIDLRPPVTRPFETVAAELEKAERTRLRQELESKFARDIEAKYPVEWSKR